MSTARIVRRRADYGMFPAIRNDVILPAFEIARQNLFRFGECFRQNIFFCDEIFFTAKIGILNGDCDYLSEMVVPIALDNLLLCFHVYFSIQLLDFLE